jgi:hypothetical protein
MQLTHPPTKQLYLNTMYDFERCIEGVATGITIKTLIQGCISLHNEGTFIILSTGYGEELAVLAKTVDEITGYEMLKILDSEYEDLGDGLFIRPSRKWEIRLRIGACRPWLHV